MLHGVSKQNDKPKADSRSFISISGLLVILSILYNAVLAFINAKIMPVTMGHVIAAELGILLIAAGYLFWNHKNLAHLSPHIIFVFFILLFSSLTIISSGEMNIKIIRDMLIIVVFILLGTMINKKALIWTFKIMTLLTLGVLFLEVFASEIYLNSFNPASYYLNTRGIEPLLDFKYFRNTVTSDSRFSFNFISEFRTSSLFLEQVSLANFSSILTIFLICFWKDLKISEKCLFIFSVVFFLLTNDSRTGSALVIVMFAGYFIFPKLPKYSHFLIMPGIFVMIMLFYDPAINSLQSDDLKGRLGLTAYKISTLDFQTLFLGNMKDVNSTADSGYIYLIYALSVFGALTYWIYTSFMMAGDQKEIAKRFAYGASLFIALNLMTSWAVFTIKVVAPLWVMGGYLYQQAYLAKNIEKKPLLRVDL